MANSEFKRMLAAAADAALKDDQPPQPLSGSGRNGGHSTFRSLRGVAAGAALVAAARYAAKRGPGPMSLVKHLPTPDLPDFSELTERAKDLIDDWFPEDEADDYEDEEEGVDEEPEPDGDEEYDDEPEAEEDEEPEDEEYDEPEAEEDEEAEAEADDDELEDEGDEEPEEDEEELEDEEDEEYDDEPSERVDPPARPPRPPKRKKAKTG